MAANRLAQGGRFWGRYLQRANSGTGSKQWLIVDYSLIAGTEAITAMPVDKKVSSQLLSNPQSKQRNVEKTPKVSRGLLWVVEQLSGLTQYADQTLTLQTTGFWVSNGLPYYQVWSFLFLITFSSAAAVNHLFYSSGKIIPAYKPSQNQNGGWALQPF
jgi:hypothetical protein